MSKRRKRSPQNRARPTTDTHDLAKARSEAERTEGISADDKAAQWLAAQERGEKPQPSPGPWRSKPATSAQARALRKLGANPTEFPTRGAAADRVRRGNRK